MNPLFLWQVFGQTLFIVCVDSCQSLEGSQFHPNGSLFHLLLSYSQDHVYIVSEEKKLSYLRDQALHPTPSLKRGTAA